jgi:hypothetical protein
MALPILKHPTFDLTVPSSKTKLIYRPFLVKEEKILLLTQESDKLSDLVRSVKQIINNCIVEGEINLDEAPTFDIEYIFLKLRANSVSDFAKFTLTDEETKKQVKIEFDLKEVEITENEDHSPIVKLANNIKLQMKYPTYTILGKFGLDDSPGATVKATFDMIKACIDKVVVGDGEEQEIHEFKDYSNQEVDDFIESLTSQNFRDVQNFFDTMPKLQHDVEYKVGKKTKTRTFTGLADFFQSA